MTANTDTQGRRRKWEAGNRKQKMSLILEDNGVAGAKTEIAEPDRCYRSHMYVH